MPPETLNLPLITREASLRLVRGEGDDMTIDVIWTTGATVQRRRYEGWDDVVEYDEELVVTPGAVRMDRLNAGAPFLDSHRSWGLESVVGAVLPGTDADAGTAGAGAAAVLPAAAAPPRSPIVESDRNRAANGFGNWARRQAAAPAGTVPAPAAPARSPDPAAVATPAPAPRSPVPAPVPASTPATEPDAAADADNGSDR